MAAALVMNLPAARAQSIQAGLKVGANFTQLDGKTWDNGYKTNLLGGVFVGVRALRFGVQAEALFNQASYKTGKDFGTLYKAYYNDVRDSAKQGNFRVNYLSIPILLQVKVAGPLVLLVGPQFSGVVSVNDKDKLVKDAKSLFKSGSVDAVAGVQLNLPMHINAGARYVIGLSDINSMSAASDSWKQKALQIHVGYTF